MSPRPAPFMPVIMVAAAAVLALSAGPTCPSARAQTGGPTWVSLDTQPPGTPARVVLNRDLSTALDTWIDVFISGFYVTARVGDDGRTYQDLGVPGLPNTSAPGQPRVPQVRADLGIVTTATAATIVATQLIDVRTLPGYLVWPSPIPAQIHDGTPSVFARDSVTYAAAVDYPWVPGYGGVTRATLGGIPAAIATAYPVRWNPTSGVLTVAAHARYHFTHPGGLSTPMDLTINHSNAASDALLNWDTINSNFTIDYLKFKGSYLFVCQAAWVPDIQKLINEKKSRGFLVTVKNVLPNGQSCSQLQQIIQSWYAGTPAGWDHYCLLVGGHGSTPDCPDANGQLSDKVLSSVDLDREPEIFLGRLYVNTEAELQNQVKKIMDYETGPQVNNDQNVLLVAHREQSQDFDFTSYQEAVRFAPYTQVTPNFITCYGTNSSVGNADITNNIQNGVGVVAYMGHGMTGSWTRWCASQDSFAFAKAVALTNGSWTPAVWSIACQTGDLRQGQSLANGFMKNAAGGAVAFYGAVDETFGSIVTVLEDSLFQAVYSRGVTRHGQAIALAEHATLVADSLYGGDAVYKYVLYGDPEMEIKRSSPSSVFAPIDLITPIDLLAPCPGVGCGGGTGPTVDIQVVQASSGAPVAGVQVGLWKPRAAGDGDEVLDNRYSGPDGWVHIPVPELTAGILYVGFDGGQNRTGLDSIPVNPPVSGVGEMGAPALRFRARPSVTAGATRFEFGRALGPGGRVVVFGVDGRRVRELHALAGAVALDWDGRDSVGRPAAAGIYLARLDTGGIRRNTRLAIIR